MMTVSFASFSAEGHPDRIEKFGLIESSDHFTAYFVLSDKDGNDVAIAGTVDFEIRDEFMITLYKTSFEVMANEFSIYDLPDHTHVYGYIWQIPFGVIQKSDSRNESLMAYVRFSNHEVLLERICDNVPFPDLLKAPNKPPVLKINAPRISWCDIETKFNASSSYDPNLNAMLFRWDFGDGQNVTGSNVVSHFYQFPGNYQVKLTVEDSEGGISNITHPIKIENPEIISITKKSFEDQSGSSVYTFSIEISVSNRAPQPVLIDINEFFVKTDDELYQYERTENESDKVLDSLKRVSITLHFEILNNEIPSVLIYKDRLFVPIDDTVSKNLTVSFVDVGQGDAILIKTPDSRTVLIDAGPDDKAPELISYLYSNNVTSIDAFILTHPDEDHIGGADEVLRNFDVLSIYHPGYVRETKTYNEFVSAMLEEGCPVFTDENIDPGDRIPVSSSIDFLVLHIDKDAPDSNSASIVIKISYFEIDFLLTGDIGYNIESELLVNFTTELDIEVLKVAHHGSKYSTSNEFLEATTPEIGIIMVGADNSYGHPSSETLARLSAHQVTVLRTDIEGTITVTTDGIGLAFSFEKTSDIERDFDGSF